MRGIRKWCAVPAAALTAATMLVSATAIGTATASVTASCASGPVKVAYVPKLDTDPYWAAAELGEKIAATQIGGSIVEDEPSVATAAAQSTIIDSLVAQGGIGVIVIAANDPNAVVPALERARAAGIKTMAFDSDVSQANFNTVGQQMLASMGSIIGYSGQIGILTDGADVTNQADWANAVKAGLKTNPKYAHMKLDFVNYGQSSAQIYTQVALSEIQAYPKLKGIIIPAGIGLPAVATTLAQKGLLGKIKLTGLAPASIIGKYILEGNVTDIWWNVPDLGYMSYYMAQDLAQCKLTGAKGQTFIAGTLGKKTVGPQGVVIMGPAQVVTKQNINSFPF